MAIPKGKSREACPEGTHNAVCVQVVEFGTQKVEFKKGEEKEQRRIQLGFQLVDEQTSDGGNMVAYKEFNYTDNPGSDLMKSLKAWLGVEDGDFDVATCIGKPCLITIEQVEKKTGGTRDKITTITAPTKGAKIKKATEETKVLMFDSFDEDVFDSLPEWMKTKIAGTDEYAEATSKKKKPAAGKAVAKPTAAKSRR